MNFIIRLFKRINSFIKRAFKKNKKNLIELNDKDIERLDDVMPIKLRPFLPPTFSFD
jgi:hypothetical protein